MSYYHYMQSVYTSTLPQLNRTLRSSSVARSSSQVENDMDTSFSVLGKRERSLGEGNVVEDPVQQDAGKRSRGDAQVTTVAADLAVVKEHAQWWSSDLKSCFNICTNHLAAGSNEAVSA